MSKPERIDFQLGELERLLLTDDLSERERMMMSILHALFRDTDMATLSARMFKGSAEHARKFAGLLAMHVNRGEPKD